MNAPVVLSNPRARYDVEFTPMGEFRDLRTPGQRRKAMQFGCTHAARFDGREPRWIARIAAMMGYRAVCLGYTRSRRNGNIILSETWGLAPLSAQVSR